MSSDVQQMAERHGRILAEMAQMALEAARDLNACALAAEDPMVKARLNAAFNRTCRSLRQSMALEMRLAREAARAAKEDREERQAERKQRAQRHREQILARLSPLIWDEYDDEDEASEVEADLKFQLYDEAKADDFLAVPVEAHVERLSRELGLSRSQPSPEPAAGPAPEPPPAEPPRPAYPSAAFADHPWRGSG